jgi:hypothetical protein
VSARPRAKQTHTRWSGERRAREGKLNCINVHDKLVQSREQLMMRDI